MKKLTKIMALSLVLIMSAMLFVSCAAPAKDPKDAKAALEENGYEVMLTEDVGAGGIEATLLAMKGDEIIQITWYEESEGAKEAYEEAKEQLAELQEDSDDYADYVVGKSGKMIWMASSKDAVKAAK